MKRLLPLLLVVGCGAKPEAPGIDPGLDQLALTAIQPRLLLPSSPLDLAGDGFVDEDLGLSWVQLRGTFTPSGGGAPRPIEATLAAGFVDRKLLRIRGRGDRPDRPTPFATLGNAPGRFQGTAVVAVDSALDLTRHRTAALPIDLELASTLTPRLDAVSGGTIFVNQEIALTGQNFLLGTGEGETRAIVEGCFLPAGAQGPCAPPPKGAGRVVAGVEVVTRPAAPWDRTRVAFPFAPSIGGIHPGTFTGTVRVRNVFPDRPAIVIQGQPLSVTLRRPEISAFSPTAASLGQYVEVTGGGFVGGTPGAVTLIRLVGEFLPEGLPITRPVDLTLLPRFVSGGLLRYVLDEADELGHLTDLRQIAGTFRGTAQPIVIANGEQEAGTKNPATLGIAHVKQVVYLNFHRSFTDSLRKFGMASADQQIRARVLQVATRDYQGVNVEFRTSPPQDFVLYAQVDILGPDPNGLGLLGYDNTPGKDTGNSRLFDRIGGVNATTQEDGFPGFGGVFAEQFLGFSRFPPSSVAKLPFDTDQFDALFDPFRPDRGGSPMSPVEAFYVAALPDGSLCPSTDRKVQVACAVFVLGNLIGTTLTHETGHSLGLANPDSDGFHNPGDQPNRLMEAGGDRPFEERAEIRARGPAVFCSDEFSYLKKILPAMGGSVGGRPSCGN